MKLFKMMFLFICITGFAQTKTGTVDVDFILSKMPEITKVQEDVTTYGKSLDGDFNKKLEGYNTIVEAYKAGEAGFTADMKKTKQDEIIAMEDDINKFQENGTKLISIKRDDLLRPLYKKIGASMDKIAKAQNYTQIFQLDNSVVYFDKTYDVTFMILNDLGIEVKEE